MNDDEIKRIIAILSATYPGHSVPDLGALILSWRIGVGDLPYSVVEEAATAWIRSGERFFPTSGQIRQLVIDESGALPSASEAWEMVLARMRVTYPGIPAIPWDAPEVVRRTLRAIGGMDVVRTHDEPSILRGQFLKMYESFRSREARGITGEAVIAAGDDVLPVTSGRRNG